MGYERYEGVEGVVKREGGVRGGRGREDVWRGNTPTK